MANASTTGFGLRTVMNVGNTPATSGQSEYQIQTAPGVATNKGDPMSTQDSGGTQGYQQAQRQGKLIILPTGDGMALVFFNSIHAAFKCAVDTGKKCYKSKRTMDYKPSMFFLPCYDITNLQTTNCYNN